MDRAGTVRVLAMGVLVLALVLSGCANPTGSSGGGGDGDDGSGGGGGQPFAGILVTSDADSGAGSLRQAVADASPGDEIRFASDMTITLSSDHRGILIDKDLIINGVGRDVVITTDGTVRHFGYVNGTHRLELRNLTISDGQPRLGALDSGALVDGGAIWANHGSTLIVDNVTFDANLGRNGGAIFFAPGDSAESTLEIRNATFVGNEAIDQRTSATDRISAGGAIFFQDGSATIEGSRFESNSAEEGGNEGVADPSRLSGGALNVRDSNRNSSYSTSLAVRESEFLSNRAGANGGALNAVYTDTDIVGTRFEENRAGLRGTNVIESYLVGVSGGGAVGSYGFDGYALRVGDSDFIRNRVEGADNSPVDRAFGGGAISKYAGDFEVYSSRFFGNVVADTGADGQSAAVAPNTGSAIFYYDYQEYRFIISSSAFVGNRAVGTDYPTSGTAIVPASAIIAGDSRTELAVSFSTFSSNVLVDGATTSYGNLHFVTSDSAPWNTSYVLAANVFYFADLDRIVPAPDDPSVNFTGTIVYNVGPSSTIEGYSDTNVNTSGNPGFTTLPDNGSDDTWGTADDSYGDLYPSSGTDLDKEAELIYLPPDPLDIDGDGTTTSEYLPIDAGGGPRVINDVNVGAYES